VWRYWRAPEYGRYLAAAVALGWALAAKFSAIILLPALLLMSSYRLFMLSRQEWRWRRTVLELAGWFLIATFIFLAIYRFNGATLLADLNGQRAHQLTGHSAFLFGEISQSGWWYYFPVIFAIKTPLPVQVALSGIDLGDDILDDYRQIFAGNDVRLRWFDARSSIRPQQPGKMARDHG
jgi:hypothetical protein